MDWDKGFSASYFGMYVDPVTWKDVGRFEITGGSIKNICTGLRATADVNCVGYNTAEERWVRIYLDCRQSNGSERVPLFTGVATSPDNNYNGDLRQNALQCYSALKVAEDMLLQHGWFAPEGVSGGKLIQQLLSCVYAPLQIEDNSPLLKTNIVAEDNETLLSMTEKILNVINWRMKIAGDGTIIIEPLARRIVAQIDPTDNDIVEPTIKTTEDWFACPNVFMCYSNDEYAEAVDNSDSKLSVAGRGREIQMQETSCKLNSDETLAEYAKRRLQEEQYVELKANYRRRFMPNVLAGDVIKLNYPRQGLTGDFFINSQNVELSHGASLDEEVVRV